MNLLNDEKDNSNATSEVPGATNTNKSARRRKLLVLGVVVAAAIALGSAAIISNVSNDSPSEPDTVSSLVLSLGDTNSTSSCMPFDVAVLAEMSPAFAGTATSVERDTVTLTVDRWYTGGEATTVVLQAPSGMDALIDGFDFEVNQQYLITAAQGRVNFCGFSGISTPELSTAFEAAFGS